MARNIEIKARLAPGELSRVRRIAEALTAAPLELLEQTDTFFHVPRGRLKLRQIRGVGSELIAYERPDAPEPTLADYTVCPCASPALLGEALARCLGTRGVVTKRRALALIGQTRVHLDRVEGLGAFVEREVVLEAEQTPDDGIRIAHELLDTLGVPTEALIDLAYIDLLAPLVPP